MRNVKPGRRSHRGLYFCAVAALGLTLSACGGGSASGAASTAQSSAPTQSPSASANPPSASVNAATINWMPPTENTDGTPLTNLAGYDIHYGTASGDYTQTISVPNPGIATYVVDNLSPGTYYFAVGAVNSDGTESRLSSEVTVTIN